MLKNALLRRRLRQSPGWSGWCTLTLHSSGAQPPSSHQIHLDFSGWGVITSTANELEYGEFKPSGFPSTDYIQNPSNAQVNARVAELLSCWNVHAVDNTEASVDPDKQVAWLGMVRSTLLERLADGLNQSRLGVRAVAISASGIVAHGQNFNEESVEHRELE